MATEFGYTREIEDRVQAPCPIWLVAIAKVISGAVQGILAAVIVFPIAALVHASGVHAHLSVHWAVVLTLIPLACVAMTSLGLLLGTAFEPRQHRPHVRLRGAAAGVSRRHLLPVDQARAGVRRRHPLAPDHRPRKPPDLRRRGDARGLTHASHMHLYIIYPVLIGFCAVFLTLGLRNFRKRVLV